mgnify:CR=1 FL=1
MAGRRFRTVLLTAVRQPETSKPDKTEPIIIPRLRFFIYLWNKILSMHNLAKKIKDGDVDAFELFFKAEHDNLLFFVNSYLNDRTAAKDIVQESFIALWHIKENIDEDKNIRTLVFRIARNKTINVLKSKYYKSTVRDSNAIMAEIDALSSSYVTSQIDSLSLEELIRKTYDNLPNTIRKSFELSRKEGFTNAEIAEQLGVSVRAVEYHISASLKIFREKLKEYLLCLFVF